MDHKGDTKWKISSKLIHFQRGRNGGGGTKNTDTDILEWLNSLSKDHRIDSFRNYISLLSLCNKSSQVWWLETTGIHSVQRPAVHNQFCCAEIQVLAGHISSQALGKSSCQFRFLVGAAFLALWPVSASAVTGLLFCLCSNLPLPLSYPGI